MNIIPDDEFRISITTDCNMKCVYCHNEGNETKNSLSLESLEEIIKSSKLFGLKKVRLTGGEPLLRADIYEICDLLVNKYGLEVSINTNGVCFEVLLKLIKAHLISGVVLGIDRVGDKISKNSTVGLQADEILGNILKLKKYPIKLSISMVYSNKKDVIDMLKWCMLNDIRLKVLQQVIIGDDPVMDNDYDDMSNEIINEFNLDMVFNKYGEKCGSIADRIIVCFYHSLCAKNSCEICKYIHLRISADNKMFYCLQGRYGKFDLHKYTVGECLAKLGYIKLED